MKTIRMITYRHFIILALFGVLSFPSLGNSSDDLELSDVEEFDFHGMQVIIRQSKDVPSVTALLYFKGGTSAMTTSAEVADEYMAINLIPESPGGTVSKQYYR